MAGYSGTPLAKKLGINAGSRVRLIDPPENYFDLVAPLPDDVEISTKLRTDVDLCHLFVKRVGELRSSLPKLIGMIRQDGCIRVSWPKRASGVPSDMTEGEIRDVALPIGLVDTKVCAVDDIWSGLKLVIRKELRK